MQRSLALSPTRGSFAPLFYQGDLPAGIDAAARHGFDAVELSVRSPSDVDSRSTLRRLASAGLGVSALATGKVYYEDGLSLLDVDASRRKDAIRRVAELIELAHDLGAANVIVGGVRGRLPAQDGAEEATDVLAGAVASLAEAGARHGVTILLEPINRYETDVLNTASSAADVIARAAAPNVGLLLDTFHMNLEEPAVAATLVRHAASLKYVHLADNDRHVPGGGTLPFLQWLRVLDALDFDGYVGVEALPLPTDEEAARRAGAALKLWMDALARGPGA